MTPRKFAIWVLLGLPALTGGLLCTALVAQRDPQGSIRTWRSDNNATAIEYTVTNSMYDSGTARFSCNIRYPSGKENALDASSSPWQEGRASYTWFFHGQERGRYYALCRWIIPGEKGGIFARAQNTFSR